MLSNSDKLLLEAQALLHAIPQDFENMHPKLFPLWDDLSQRIEEHITNSIIDPFPHYLQDRLNSYKEATFTEI